MAICEVLRTRSLIDLTDGSGRRCLMPFSLVGIHRTKPLEELTFSWLDKHGLCSSEVLLIVVLCDLILEKPVGGLGPILDPAYSTGIFWVLEYFEEETFRLGNDLFKHGLEGGKKGDNILGSNVHCDV